MAAGILMALVGAALIGWLTFGGVARRLAEAATPYTAAGAVIG